MTPILTIDTLNHKVIVTIPGATYVFANRSEAYEAFPELRPAPPTPAEERRLVRMEQGQRAAGGWGSTRPGKRT